MLILMTTYPNKSRELKKLILMLVKSGVAKCVQRIQYVKSYYMREGKLKQEEEKILLIKFDESQKQKLEAMLLKHHPYEIPELVYLKPEEVSETYLAWIKS